MKLYVRVTDNNWFAFLSKIPDLDEVNYWRPSRETAFKALNFGELLLIKVYNTEISHRLRQKLKNGRYYYPFHGKILHNLRINPAGHPSSELLIWHNERLFKG
jgi:hypothetical protein